MQSIIKKIVWLSLALVPFIALYVASGCASLSGPNGDLSLQYCSNPFDLLNYGTVGLYFPFISGKNLAFRVLVEIALAGWALLALRDASYRPNLKKSPLTIAYAIFIAVILIADVFGVDSQKSIWSNFERMEGFVAHIHLFAYFFLLTVMLPTLVEWRKMFKIFLASNILVLIYAFGQFLGAKGYIFAEKFPEIAARFSNYFPIHQSENRLDATIGNSAYFAIFCLLSAAISALLWSQDANWKKAWWYPAIIVANLTALFYSGTRGTQIGLVVGLLTMLGALVFRWVDSKKEIIMVGVSTAIYALYVAAALFVNNTLLVYFAPTSYVYALILLIAAVMQFAASGERFRKIGAGIFILTIASILIFEIPAVKRSDLVQNSPTLARLASISPTEITTMSRLSIWKISYEAFKERPILGYGQDNFDYIFARKFLPEKMWNLEPWYDRSHDVFFDWLVAGGILGLLSYLSLYGVGLWLMWRKKDHTMPRYERAILTGALAAYFVHNIFVFDNLTSYILFFALLGYIVVRTGSQMGTPGKPLVNEEQLSYIWAPLIGIVLLFSVYYVNYRPYHVNRLLIRGLSIGQLVQQMPFAEAVKTSQDAFVSAVSYNTLGSDESREQFLQMGARLAQLTIPEGLPLADRQAAVQAINGFIVAVRDDVNASFPRNQEDVRMLSLYGVFFNGIGDAVSAEKILSIAHRLAPKKQLITFDLIRAYMTQGKYAEGYALARETYDSQPAYPDAQKWYVLTAIYAKSFRDAQLHMMENGQMVPFDNDILNAAVSTGQVQLALELLNEVKRSNPEYTSQVDALIRQILAAPKK